MAHRARPGTTTGNRKTLQRCTLVALAARARDRFAGARLRDSRRQNEPRAPLGEAVDVLLTREDAERFMAEVRGDDVELASHLRIEERELDGSSSLN